MALPLYLFLLFVQELFHGWKMYDYLVYTRYRFLQRETRWKGMEDSLDECIEEGMRTLDQMCFSSQFYMMCTIHVTGIMFAIFGLEIILRARYNIFGDPALLILGPMIIIECYVLQRILVFVADKLGVWQIKHANTAWHATIGDDEDDDFGIPKWDELEKLKGASHEQYLMNQKLTSETFRHKFLDYNRPWLVAQLPSILTPRTLRRSRPYLVAQLSKLLGSVNPDISSDTEEEGGPKYGPVSLSSASRTIVRLWLAKARRLMRLREVVQPLINRAKKDRCEVCLSQRQLQVELIRSIEELADEFEAQHPNMAEFDQVAWKQFFEQNQRYRTICLSCLGDKRQKEKEKAAGAYVSDEEGDGAKFGPVFLNAASKAIVKMWHQRARAKMGTRPKQRRAQRAVSSDDEEDDIRAEADWARKPLQLSAASKAVAQLWLQKARFSLSVSGGNRGGMTHDEAQALRVKKSKAPSGKKSRFRRK